MKRTSRQPSPLSPWAFQGTDLTVRMPVWECVISSVHYAGRSVYVRLDESQQCHRCWAQTLSHHAVSPLLSLTHTHTPWPTIYRVTQGQHDEAQHTKPQHEAPQYEVNYQDGTHLLYFITKRKSLIIIV